MLPIGIESDDLQADWLSNMNSFGEGRGIFAHTSASSYQLQQPPDPKSELDTVNRIVYGKENNQEIFQGLIEIDQLLNDLMK